MIYSSFVAETNHCAVYITHPLYNKKSSQVLGVKLDVVEKPEFNIISLLQNGTM